MMDRLLVFQATQNSSGVNPVTLHINDSIITGSDDWTFCPPATLSSLDDESDWRTATFHRTKAAAVSEYVALEKQRIKRAKDSLAALQVQLKARAKCFTTR